MKYPIDFLNKVVNADCLEAMKHIPDNTIDTIITDPPYGLTSITKRFGKNGSAKAKYGQDGSFQRLSGGFMGKLWDGTGIAFQKETWQEVLRVAKPGATLLCFGGTRTFHRVACAIEDAGWIIKDCLFWVYASGFPKATDISKQLDKKMGIEREITRKEKEPYRMGESIKFDQRNSGSREKREKPATPEAKFWNGWKSHGLKPAVEPIILAIKANSGSYAENAIQWGCAGLNIDGGRINYNGEKPNLGGRPNHTRGDGYGFNAQKENAVANTQGRFPSNLILECICETETHTNPECPCCVLDEQQNGASRFFYQAKASRKERNMGCDDLEEKAQNSDSKIRTYNDRCKNCGKKFIGSPETICHCDNPETDKTIYKNKNNHPTVKPLKLMEYLCTLTKTPTGGIVLDLFAGSGTTGMAAKKTGRDYILIEKESEYVEICRARINAITKQGLTGILFDYKQ